MSRSVFCYGQSGASNCTVLHNFDWEVFDDSKKEVKVKGKFYTWT